MCCSQRLTVRRWHRILSLFCPLGTESTESEQMADSEAATAASKHELKQEVVGAVLADVADVAIIGDEDPDLHDCAVCVGNRMRLLLCLSAA